MAGTGAAGMKRMGQQQQDEGPHGEQLMGTQQDGGPQDTGLQSRVGPQGRQHPEDDWQEGTMTIMGWQLTDEQQGGGPQDTGLQSRVGPQGGQHPEDWQEGRHSMDWQLVGMQQGGGPQDTGLQSMVGPQGGQHPEDWQEGRHSMGWQLGEQPEEQLVWHMAGAESGCVWSVAVGDCAPCCFPAAFIPGAGRGHCRSCPQTSS